MRIVDMTEIYKKYQKKWVALTEDKKVIAAAATLSAVLKKAHQKGFDNPITAKIPDFDVEYVL